MAIVYARPPKRIRRKKPTVELNIPVVIDARKPFDAERHRKAGDAADKLWRELVRRATEPKK